MSNRYCSNKWHSKVNNLVHILHNQQKIYSNIHRSPLILFFTTLIVQWRIQILNTKLSYRHRTFLVRDTRNAYSLQACASHCQRSLLCRSFRSDFFTKLTKEAFIYYVTKMPHCPKRWGARSNMAGIICPPLVRIGLSDISDPKRH